MGLFDTGFAFYGETTKSKREEIKADVKRALTEAINTTVFDRLRGSSLGSLENTTMNDMRLMMAKAWAVETIGHYNARVPSDRRVLTSQQLVLVDLAPENFVATIGVIYIIESEIGTTRDFNNLVQMVAVPIRG